MWRGRRVCEVGSVVPNGTWLFLARDPRNQFLGNFRAVPGGTRNAADVRGCCPYRAGVVWRFGCPVLLRAARTGRFKACKHKKMGAHCDHKPEVITHYSSTHAPCGLWKASACLVLPSSVRATH